MVLGVVFCKYCAREGVVMNNVTQHQGSVLGIQFTDAARDHVLKYLKQRSHSQGVRISLKKSGCSGLAYIIDYVDAPEPTDVAFVLTADYWVYIEKKSYPFLRGMTVDYVKQGINQKLVFNNPNQTGQCGCGESFTVDEV